MAFCEAFGLPPEPPPAFGVRQVIARRAAEELHDGAVLNYRGQRFLHLAAPADGGVVLALNFADLSTAALALVRGDFWRVVAIIVLTTVPLFWLARFARRRIAYHGDWVRAVRRGGSKRCIRTRTSTTRRWR